MRIALCLILSFISQVICPQTTFLQKVKEGLKERILELDPIEGVYEFETSGYASIDGVSQSNKDQGIWAIYNIKGTKDYIVTNENGYGDGRKITQRKEEDAAQAQAQKERNVSRGNLKPRGFLDEQNQVENQSRQHHPDAHNLNGAATFVV